jgi:hypothetical protein
VKKTLTIDLERPRTRKMFTSEEFRHYERVLKESIWEEDEPEEMVPVQEKRSA